MKVYAGMDPRLRLGEVAAHARRVEALGCDGLHVAETVHDPFTVAVLALEHTEAILVRTSVALAFVRSPLVTAYASWDLSALSGGRFQLGLGSQIRQNIEERYGMTWSEPVARLGDYVDAVRAAFGAFARGGGIDHRGSHYRLTRLQPYFNPGPDDTVPEPPIYLGGVNAAMCRLAGSRADGFVAHPTNSSPRYLEAYALAEVAAGAASAGRSLHDLELVAGTPVVTGGDAAAVDAERERQRRLLAFLYSTPAYRPTLELHGRGDLPERLQALIRDDRWADLGELIDDDLLEQLVPVARLDQLPEVIAERFGHLVDGVVLQLPADPAHDPAFADAVHRLHRLPPRPGPAPHPREPGASAKPSTGTGLS